MQSNVLPTFTPCHTYCIHIAQPDSLELRGHLVTVSERHISRSASQRYVGRKGEKWTKMSLIISYYNSSSVCVLVCSLCTPRSFDGSSPNLVGVCRLTSHLPLRGSFSKRSTGRRVNGSLSLSTILYRDQPHTTQLQRRLLLGKPHESNSAPFAVVHVNDVCRWTWQLLLRGSFF